MLSVLLLGPPQVLLDGRLLKVPRRKNRALLYYLAAQPGPLTRERLLNTFWPDLERPAALQTMRTGLYGLRKAIGPALLTEGDRVALAAEVDAPAFEAGVQAAGSQDLAAALDLYRGDFLADFNLPDAPAFETWANLERERYRRLALRGLSALSQQHEAARDYAAALEAIHRALAFDPLQEDLQRIALRLQTLAGDRAGAIRRYETLRKLLDEELGVPPMAETRALYDAIINDTLAPGVPPLRLRPPALEHPGARSLPPGGEILPFTGRAAELATLQRLAGGSRLVLVEGEAGIGKTRLVEEYLQGSQALALRGAARELEGALPYQPVIEALRGMLRRPGVRPLLAEMQLPDVWLAEVARLLPELAVARPDLLPATLPPDESRLWEGVSQFLLALGRAARRTVLLFLDDLQSADASTLALLGYLVRQAETRPAPAPLCFLAAARSPAPRTPLGGLLQALTRTDRLARLPLNRLTPADTASLARQISPRHAARLAGWFDRIAEGNPYILAELIRSAREAGLLSPEGELHDTAPELPQSVYSLIQSRLARLSDAARRMLDVAVAVGRQFDFNLVARAAGLSETTALDALDELRAGALIHPLPDDPSGQLHAFDHNLTMEVAYREVGEARHRLLHRRVAEALEAMHRDRPGAVAGLLAWHFSEGSAPERAAPHAFRAGQHAAGLAGWAEAIAFYEQALAGAREGERGPILLALGEARLRAGQPAGSSEAFREALALAESPGADPSAPATRLALARSLLVQGRYAEAISLAQRVLAADPPDHALNAELIWGTALSLEGGDLAGAAEHLLHARTLAAASEDPLPLTHVTFELGSVAAQQGDLPRAVALYRQAISVAESAEPGDDQTWHILAYNNLAYHLHLMGDPAAAAHAHTGLRKAHETGALPLLTYLHSTLGEIALAASDLDGAGSHFAEGLALAERLSMPERIAGLTANLGRLALARGETTLAVHRLSTALARADALGTRHLAAQIRLWLAPLLPPAEARAALAEVRAFAAAGHRQRLLEEALRLERA